MDEVLLRFICWLPVLSMIFIQSLIGAAGTSSCTDVITEGTAGFQDGPSLCGVLTDKLNTTSCDTVVVQRSTMSMIQPLTFIDPCILSIASNVALRFQCDGAAVVSYACPTSLYLPCFTFSFGRSIEIVGCRVQGSLLSAFNVTNSTFTLRDSVLDGRNTQMPLDLVGWHTVLIENVTIMNGKNMKTFGGGGGCVAVRGCSGTVTFRNVFIQNCNALGAGGCMSITGDGEDRVTQDFHLDSSDYGGHVLLEAINLKNCRSSMHRGGLLNVQFMTTVSITNSRFSNGTAQMMGGIQIQGIASNITLLWNVVTKCNSFLQDVGCVSIAPRATHYPGNEIFITIRDMIVSDCFAQQLSGCMEITNLDGSVLLENVNFQRCTAVESYGCLYLEDTRNKVLLHNVSLSDCTSLKGGGAGLSMIRTNVVNISQVTIRNAFAQTVAGGFLQAETRDGITVATDFTIINTTATQGFYNGHRERGSCIFIYNATGTKTFLSAKMSCGYSSARRGRRMFHTIGDNNKVFQGIGNVTEFDFPEIFETSTKTVPKGGTVFINSMSAPFVPTAGMSQGTKTQSAFVYLSRIASVSAESIVHTSWVGMMVFDCNRYHLTDVEELVANQFSLSSSSHLYLPPRFYNLVVNLCVFIVISLLDAFVACIGVYCQREPYPSLMYPNVTTRAFVFFLCDFCAACVCCMGYAGTSIVIGVLVFLLVWTALCGVIRHIQGHLQIYDEVRYEALPKFSETNSVVNWFIVVNGSWIDIDTSSTTMGIARKFRFLFDMYDAEYLRYWWVDLIATCVLGILGGIPVSSRNECVAMYGATLVALVVIFLLQFVYLRTRYHTSRDEVRAVVVMGTLVVGTSTRLFQHSASDEGHDESTTNRFESIVLCCVAVAVVVSVVLNVCGLCGSFREIPVVKDIESERDTDDAKPLFLS